MTLVAKKITIIKLAWTRDGWDGDS